MNPYRLPDLQLESLLADDAPCGDLTSHALGLGASQGRIVFAARADMVVCGAEEAARLGELRGLSVQGPVVASGSAVASGTSILTLAGGAGEMHTVWKTAQTLMEFMSGIASLTRALVDVARAVNPDICVACTRKHFPGTKAAAIKAIYCGGAVPHRLGLSDTVLVFPEHLQFLADTTPASVVARLRRSCPERRLVVEVCSPEAAAEWAVAGADVLQLEKMDPATVRGIVDAVRQRNPLPVIAAAGGIKLENAAAYAAAGADVLVTSAPYLAPPRDVQVEFSG